MNKSKIVFLTAIIVIPIAVISLACCFSAMLKEDILTLTTMIDEIDAMIRNSTTEDKDILDKSVDFNEKWNKSSERWCFFLDHEVIHQIGIMSAEYKSEVDNGEYFSALITSAKIKEIFKTLEEYDKFNISNLF